MIASAHLDDIIMAAVVCIGILFILATVAGMIIWGVLRHDNKVGPLAAAEQEAQIAHLKARAIIEAKKAEAEIFLADSKVIEARQHAINVQSEILGDERYPA